MPSTRLALTDSLASSTVGPPVGRTAPRNSARELLDLAPGSSMPRPCREDASPPACQPDDSQTRAMAHLRMRLVGENAFKEPGRVRANGLRPMHHARGCPFQMRLVG